MLAGCLPRPVDIYSYKYNHGIIIAAVKHAAAHNAMIVTWGQSLPQPHALNKLSIAYFKIPMASGRLEQ